jgi:hypothetical protein
MLDFRYKTLINDRLESNMLQLLNQKDKDIYMLPLRLQMDSKMDEPQSG